jgi:hypothetical protein
MPVFPNTSLYYKGRTNTQLVVSEGNAPAEKYLASEATNSSVKFAYEFGPEGNNGVVIPKGKILSFAGVEYDVETEKYIPRVKIAGAGEVPMGVNHHNVYQRLRDKFSGSEPTVLTREYIRVPLFTGNDLSAAQGAAAAIQFGAMAAACSTGTASEIQAAKNALFGKYVKADANGNFVVADPASDTYDKIVGQVYGIETDIPPAGFLQYFMEMNENDYTAFIKGSQIVPSPGRTQDKANSLSIDTFPVGTGYFKTSRDLALALKNFRAGIPFLTDGYFKARTNKVYELGDTTNIIDVRTMGHVTVAPTTEVATDVDHVYGVGTNPLRNVVTVSDTVGSALFIRLKDDICHDALPSYDITRDIVPIESNFPEYGSLGQSAVVVKLLDAAGANPVTVSPANYHVDYENNLIVIYFTEAVSAKNIQITATVLENQIPGIPTGWDYKGNIGEARILLMK